MLLSESVFGQTNYYPLPNGNVGIGCFQPPTSKLEIWSQATPSGTPALSIVQDLSSLNDNDLLRVFRMGFVWPPSINIPAQQYFNIKNDGKVGVGTNSPVAQFDLQTIGSNIPFQVLNNAGLELLRVNTTGVGIGRTSTFAALDVQSIGGNSPLIARNSSGFATFIVTNNSGRVGVGTDAPVTQVEIYSQSGNDPFQVSNSSGQQILRVNANGRRVGVGFNATPTAQLEVRSLPTGTPFQISSNAGNILFKAIADGKIQIGATAPSGTFANYKLGVDGDIVAKRVVVQTASWADKVFDKSYILQPLSEIEAFVKENCHLPQIPTEKEVIENGIDVSEMNKLLLQKVEELTLYLIKQDKSIKELEQIVNAKN